MSVTVQTKGLRELKKALDALPDKINKKVLDSAVRAGANVIKKEAQSNVNIRPTQNDNEGGKRNRAPGSLRKGISVAKVKGTGTRVHFVVGTRKKAFYGRFLEFGTKHIAPRPWLRPAYESKKAAAQAAFVKSLSRGLKREIKALGKGINLKYLTKGKRR